MINSHNKTPHSTRITIFLISLYLLLPLVLTFVYSAFTQWTDILPKGFTLKYYIEILSNKEFLIPLVRSIVISIIPVMINTVVILLAFYVVIFYHPQWSGIMGILCTIPYALQGVVLAISVLSLYAGLPLPFSNRVVMLIGTYCVLVLPYLYRGIKNSLDAINPLALMEAAQILGAPKLYAYVRVIVPNIMNGIWVSVLLAVAIVFGDFVIVNLIGGSYFTTAQMYLYKASFQSGQQASAIVTILFLVTLLITGTVNFLSGRNKKMKVEETQDGIH